MTPRTSIFALAALAAVAAMAIATTPASAAGRFLAPRPIFTPGQVVENCHGNPRLGCAVHIEPSRPGRIVENCQGDPRLGCAVRIEPAPSVPVAATCPLRARFSVRVAASMPYGVAVRRVPGPFAPRGYPRFRGF